MSNQNIYIINKGKQTSMSSNFSIKFDLCFTPLIFFLTIINVKCLTYSVALSNTTRGTNLTPIDLSASGYSPNDLLKIKLQFLTGHPLATTAMIVSLNQPRLYSTIQLSQFYHKTPFQMRGTCDLDAMWQSRDQRVNIQRNSQTHLYIAVVNYDLSYRVGTSTYTVTVDAPSQTVYDCQSCQNNGIASANCFCTGCMSQYTGKICSRSITEIQKNISFGMSPFQFQYYSISNTNRVTIQITPIGGIAQAYFQFQEYQGEVATFFNVAKGSTDGRYVLSNNNLLKLTADTQQRKLLITVVNFSPNPINMNINYTQQNTVSALVIVMSVLGGILLIALIIAIVCIVKRRNSTRSRVQSQLNLPSDTNKLTSQQIQRYFPVCPYSDLSNPAQSTMQPMGTQNLKQGQTDQECIICLQQIKYSDLVRMGYCKHIYHGECLISWFKKQRNCPMCRKQWTREDTTAEYNKLVAQNGNIVLRDTSLVKAIYNRKLTLSKTVIQNME